MLNIFVICHNFVLNAFEAEKMNFSKEDDLIYAVQKSDFITIEKLISEGVDLNFFDDIGLTALHYAVKNEDLKLIQYLVNAGANINAQDQTKAGDTPLGSVAGKCSYEVAKLLIDLGANPRLSGHMQLTAIDRAQDRKSPEGLKVLNLFKSVL